MNIERKILLNPGPATTSDTVKMAQVVPDICPREKEFGDIMEYISVNLADIVADSKTHAAVLLGGSGTAGVEAVLSSVIGENESVVVVNNGAYGKRMCEICKIHKIDFVEYKSSKIEQINFTDFENFIIEQKKIKNNLKYISCIHSETTTGLLTDIKRVGDLAKKYDMTLIVDAMSSFAGLPINMQDMNISYLVASANKNIQGMAGVVFIIAPKSLLSDHAHKAPRTLYLDIFAQYDYFIKTKQMRFTPPVQTLYALKQAIDEFKEETAEKRYARYRENWKTLREGLHKLGLKTLVSDEDHSNIITSVIEPTDIKGYSFESMHDYLYKRNITIYPGKISDQNTFRIANIGAIDKKDILLFLGELKNYFESLK